MFKNKNVKLIIVLFIVVIPLTDSFAYKFDFTTVSDIVTKVKKRFGDLESYRANFVIKIEKQGKTKVQRGVIKYRSKDLLHVSFSKPYGQKIISNGKSLWLYIPALNVVAQQDLKGGSIFAAGTKTGLKRLFSKYHYRFSSKTQPETLKNGKMAYVLFLKQRESRSGFKTLKLWVNKDFFITRVVGKSSTGKSIDISFTNIKININLPKGIFKFDVPSRAKVLKNPMIADTKE